jgi:ribonuclease P protein component
MSSLKFIANPRRTSYRLAIVVSKKVNKSAVVRNRIRRRLYEAFRQRESQFKQPTDMVMTVFHEQIAEVPAKDLQKIVDQQLVQAGIID